MRISKAFKGTTLLITLFALVVAPLDAFAGSGSKAESRRPLLRPADAEDPRIRGEVRLRSRGDRERFEVKVKYADPEATYDLYMRHDAMEFSRIDELERSGKELEYEARVRDGSGSLPFDVASVSELAGYEVEVRVGATIVLYGTVGDFTAERRARAREELDPVTAPDRARARLRVRSDPRRGDERLEVKVNRLVLPEGEDLVLFMEDPLYLGGELVEVATFQNRKGKRFRYRVRTRRGQGLPFGVPSVRDLSGLEVEIRNSVSMEVAFDGLMPNL